MLFNHGVHQFLLARHPCLKQILSRSFDLPQRTIHVYVHELKDGKIYVGASDNVSKRFAAHRSGKGAKWTKLYPAIRPIEILFNVSRSEEKEKTNEYIRLYGAENVRGGVYCRVKTPKYAKKKLEPQIQPK